MKAVIALVLMSISAQADLVTRRSNVPSWGAAVYRKYTEE